MNSPSHSRTSKPIAVHRGSRRWVLETHSGTPMLLGSLLPAPAQGSQELCKYKKHKGISSAWYVCVCALVCARVCARGRVEGLAHYTTPTKASSSDQAHIGPREQCRSVSRRAKKASLLGTVSPYPGSLCIRDEATTEFKTS